jgi:AhpD family alkylhydroperoxidase
MQPRMRNPAVSVPGAMQAMRALEAAVKKGDVPARTLELVNLRTSQINGCSLCVDTHPHDLNKGGESDERLFALAAWREAPFCTDAERAALALAEAATRLSDRADAVPDEVWDEAARHHDEPALAALVLNIALINCWNRINATTQQVAGSFRH